MTSVPINVSEEFLDMFATRVADIVAARLGEHTEWLRVDQAAEHLGTTPNGIRALVKRGRIPVHRRDGRLYFDRRELDTYIRGNA
jgi:excisionase family DNA binding protein